MGPCRGTPSRTTSTPTSAWEWHGTNAFIREGDDIFRTYFVDTRGDEAMGSTWAYLDITALGRQEEWEDSPEGYPQTRLTSGGTSMTSTDDAVATAKPSTVAYCSPRSASTLTSANTAEWV